MQTARLILNGINGIYLREIIDNAGECDSVDAAVAYTTREDLLFEWCWKKSIPLRYYGRFDDTVPVPSRILKQFLDRKSPNFVCRLLPHFHSKVIWWHGIGVYVGSANLTDAAWYSNIEAGCYFDAASIAASGMDVELTEFFRQVDEKSSPLSKELFDAVVARERELQKLAQNDLQQRKHFLSAPGLKAFDGLLRTTASSANSERRRQFLDEWYATLQILRDVGARVSDDNNRPAWIPADTPAGAQADQFLHAHYYNRVVGEGNRSYFVEMHEANKNSPETALRNAIAWWKSLKAPPSGEDRTLFEWAPFLRKALAQARVLNLSVNDLEAICQRVHAIQDHARRTPNVVVGLPPGSHSMAIRTKALAKYLYGRRAPNGKTVLETLDHVLYGGPSAETPDRLWETTSAGKWHIDHLGISSMGELVGWALPDDFPPRNNRTSKSLRSLGFSASATD